MIKHLTPKTKKEIKKAKVKDYFYEFFKALDYGNLLTLIVFSIVGFVVGTIEESLFFLIMGVIACIKLFMDIAVGFMEASDEIKLKLKY